MKIRGTGILRHQFFGVYGACIALEFASEGDAREALDVFGRPWRIGDKNKNILVCQFNADGVEKFKEKYHPVAFKCQRRECRGKIHEIDGVDHSIDIGSPFELVVEVPNKHQLQLF